MKALLRRDLGVFLLFGAIGNVVIFLFLKENSFSQAWLEPGDQVARSCFEAWWISSLLFGVFLGNLDWMMGTAEYVRHRHVSLRQIFWTRAVGGLVVVASWLVLPLVVHRLVTGAGADVPTSGRFLEYIGVASIGLATYAAGWFHSHFPGSSWTRILAAMFTCVVITMVGRHFSTEPEAGWTVPLLPYVLVQLLFTALLLGTAARAFVHGTDPDQPLRGPAGVWCGAVLTVLGVGFLVFVVQGVQSTLQKKLIHSYPRAGLDADQQVVLYESRILRPGFRVVDGTLQMVDRQPAERPRYLGAPNEILGPQTTWRELQRDRSVQAAARRFFFSGEYQKVGHGWAWATFLGRPSGLFLVVQSERPDGGGPQRLELGKTAGPAHFSAGTEVIGYQSRFHWEDAPAVWLGDPEDGSLWCYRLGATQLERGSLPGGDRYRDWRWKDDQVLVQGQRGMYRLEGEEFVAAEVEPELFAGPARRVEFPDRDPVTPTLAVVNRAGETLFEHTYRPVDVRQRVAALGLAVTSVLRPALLQGVTHLSASDSLFTFRADSWTDPMVAGGRRPGLVVLAFVVTLLLTAHLAWLLQRRGLPAGRRNLWLALVLIGGFGAWTVCLFVETRRAWQSLPEVSEPRAPLIGPDLAAARS